jgi:hypothetical protein
MDTLANQKAVPYNKGTPGTIYFQEGCTQTHVQNGRVYDAVGNQHAPDIVGLWNKGQAVPFDLQQHLIVENRRRQIETKMAAELAAMEAEQQATLARVNQEMQEMQDREYAKERRPLGEFSLPPGAIQPVGPAPQVLPEMQDLAFLKALVPVTAPVVHDHLGMGTAQQIVSRIREAPEIPGYTPGMKG